MNNGLNARQLQIMERIQELGEIKIPELSEALQVTEMTIRRDIEKLESLGSVKRTFGGAIFVGKDVALQDRTGIRIEEKQRIGRAAAKLIQAGDSIFIDGGTTTLEVAKHIPKGLNITVVTNAMNVALELAGKEIQTMVTGGMLRESTSSLVGPVAAQALSGMAFDRAFLGATGIDEQHGFSNSNLYETEIKRLAIRQANETTVVLDHSKFGAKVLASFASLGAIRRMVTDRLPPEGLALACQEAGLELIVADDTGGKQQ
ncbi:DeoR/GlpR transcriptional regulator [Cohnella endophytica]|uniref:DeoR/GlpR transcriptional regulator n=1 Tax=Cohnella endophytica TaxID=2419778 RepID=A0A494XVG9_9BACL|nr:DeoR/GlpR family DNA-binding transcription regulator [Cohnella endophytica]RKP52936.1 DeoR/GlpR transcriptional regulator [Cohnella endophytica]